MGNKAHVETIMNIIWSPQAKADLASVHAFISNDDPAAARRTTLHILDTVETILAEYPGIGHAGRVPGTREFVVPKTPFIIPYRIVSSKRIHVLRVYHGARRWPERF